MPEFQKDPFYKEAYRLFTEENYGEAAHFFKLLTLNFPYENLLWQSLGASLFGSQKFSEAKGAFQASLLLNHEDPETWIHLGECELKMGNNETAKSLFQKASSLAMFLPIHQERIHKLLECVCPLY